MKRETKQTYKMLFWLIVVIAATQAFVGCDADSPTAPTATATPAPTPEPTPEPAAFFCHPVDTDLDHSCPNTGEQGPVFDLLVEVQASFHRDEGAHLLRSDGRVIDETSYRNGLANYFRAVVPKVWCVHAPNRPPDEIFFKLPNIPATRGSESWSMDVVTAAGCPWVGTAARCRPAVFSEPRFVGGACR